MGTRNLTCVVKDGEFVVAKYCQWDGYPSGQGVTILDFLKNRFNREKFEKQLELVETISEEKMNQFWMEAGASDSEERGGLVSMEVADRLRRWFPQLDRDMGGEILEFIQEFPDMLDYAVKQDAARPWHIIPKALGNEEDLPSALDAMGGKILLQNSLDFAKDSLFCEWCYVLDLDKNELEVYQGFNCGAPGRFGDEPDEKGYRPVGLVVAYSLTDLPDEDTFLEDLNEEE